MAVASPKDRPEQYKIAKEFLDRHDGDVLKASEAMAKHVKNNMPLYRAIMDELVQGACYNLIRGECRGGKYLGEAKRDEVNAASEFYRAQGRNMTVKATWLEKIARRLTNDRTVSEVLDETKLTKLQSEAENEI